MKNDRNDPLGYYQLLGVSADATEDEIKTAFKKKAMQYHPDRNPGKDTTKQFQDIQKAFEVLSDANLRAQYDLTSLGKQVKSTTVEPVVCTKCNKVSAQPRYVIFYRVISIIFMSYKTPIQGIYCSDCASNISLKNSAITWTLGWWGFPWGILWSIQVLFTNLFGGQSLYALNANLLLHQSIYFYTKGDLKTAKAIASKGLELINKVKKDTAKDGLSEDEVESIRKNLNEILSNELKKTDSETLKDVWGFKSKIFLNQLILGLLAIVGISALLNQDSYNKSNQSSAIQEDFSSYEKPKTDDFSSYEEPNTLGQKQNSEINRYVIDLASHISMFKKYPRIAQRKGWEGNTVVKLVMSGAGNIQSLSIEQSSGYKALDEEAINMIYRAIPLPKPPNILSGDEINIHVPVSFTLNN